MLEFEHEAIVKKQKADWTDLERIVSFVQKPTPRFSISYLKYNLYSIPVALGCPSNFDVLFCNLVDYFW